MKYTLTRVILSVALSFSFSLRKFNPHSMWVRFHSSHFFGVCSSTGSQSLNYQLLRTKIFIGFPTKASQVINQQVLRQTCHENQIILSRYLDKMVSLQKKKIMIEKRTSNRVQKLPQLLWHDVK